MIRPTPLASRSFFSAPSPAPRLLPHYHLHIRHASSSSSTPPPPPPDASSAGTRSNTFASFSSTTFSAKSAPREVYHRPETQRGMPPAGVKPAWASSGSGSGSGAASSAKVIKREGDPEGEKFAGPSRPRAVYERPGERELPRIGKRWPWLLALGLLGLGWGAFVVQATNAERLASSIMKQVQFQLRHSEDVRLLLGDAIHLEPGLFGVLDPWISGSVNMLQGRVDLKFRVRGTTGPGTVYFTSIRPQQESTWRIVRFKVIADSGATLRLDDKV